MKELKAALQFAPKDVALIGELGTALYLSRDYEPALAMLGPIMEQPPANEDVRVLTAYGDSLLQSDRVEDAVRTLARWLIDERGHHRLTIDPAVANEPAIRAYEAVGFKRVGVMRRYWRDPEGVWQDGLLLDLLADEL